jgi:uncharacterized membrane protein
MPHLFLSRHSRLWPWSHHQHHGQYHHQHKHTLGMIIRLLRRKNSFYYFAQAINLTDVDLMTCHTYLTPSILDRRLLHTTNTMATMINNMVPVMTTITISNVTDIKEAIVGNVKKNNAKNVHSKIKMYYF